MRELRAETFAEIARGTRERLVYEREVLEVLDRGIGCDVGFFTHAEGASPVAIGLDERVRVAVAPRWETFREEHEPVRARGMREGNVAVDVEHFGVRGLERTEVYQSLMRPHGGRSTAMVYLTIDGEMIGGIVLGRRAPGFSAKELLRLRSYVATLTLCELRFGRASCVVGTHATLTRSEREVVELLGLGYTNAQIAQTLGKATRTVRNQLSSAYEKLGVATRAEAVAVLARLRR